MLTNRKLTTSECRAAEDKATSYAAGHALPATPRLIGVRKPNGRVERLAHVISSVGSPPVLASAVVVLAALKLASPRAWMWCGIYVLLGVLLPFLYVVWLVKRGDVTDIDVQLRKQRAQPLLVTIFCTGLAWLVLTLGLAPTTLVILAGAIWVQSAAIFAVTLGWKISVHVATAAGTATMVWVLLGTPLPFLLTVPLVAWSRVRLRRHTLPQTLVGALLGLVIFVAAATFMPSG